MNLWNLIIVCFTDQALLCCLPGGKVLIPLSISHWDVSAGAVTLLEFAFFSATENFDGGQFAYLC